MPTIAYLRVSKDSQDVKNQELAILQFALKEGITVDDFIKLTVSSRRSTKERKIDELLAKLSEGDRLIVSELSRMGRSVGQVNYHDNRHASEKENPLYRHQGEYPTKRNAGFTEQSDGDNV